MLKQKNEKSDKKNKALKIFAAAASGLIMGCLMSVGVNASSAGCVATNSGNLNVRSSPSSSGDIIASVAKNSYLTLERLNGEWWYAEFDNGRYGYLYSGYVKELDSRSASVDVDGSYLNVRSGPGVSYKAFDEIGRAHV